MSSLCFVIVMAFASLPLEVLCETAEFPKSNNSEMNDELRRNFTDMHNYLRSQLALGKVKKINGLLPAASNMIKLEWDCCLERNATEYIRTCPHEGSEENRRDSIAELFKRMPVSEVPPDNIKAAARNAVTSWWKNAREVTENKLEKMRRFKRIWSARLSRVLRRWHGLRQPNSDVP